MRNFAWSTAIVTGQLALLLVLGATLAGMLRW